MTRLRAFLVGLVVGLTVLSGVSAQVEPIPSRTTLPYLTMLGDITMANGKAIKTGTTAADTLLLQAYDTDTGPGYITFATLTAGNTPTMDLATGVTIGTAYVYRAGGTDVAVADGGTGLSSYAVGDVLYASATGTLAGRAAVAVGQVLASAGVNTAPAYTATPTLTDVIFTNGGALKSGTTLGDTLLIQGYDTDTGPAYTTVATVTAGLVPKIAIPTITGSVAISAGALTITQGTPATAIPALNLTSTWNDAGVTHLGIKYVITDTASAAGSLPFQILGGAAGTTNLFRVLKDGSVTIGNSLFFSYGYADTAGYLGINGRLSLKASADGVGVLGNWGQTGFTTLNLGPTTGNTAAGTLSISKVVITCTIATDTGCTGHGTGTITTTTGIPAGSLVLGVDARVTTIIAGSDGIATWALGYAGDTDAWGAGLALAATTTTGIANFTVTTPPYFTAATNITLSGTGGKIIDSGVVKLTIYYIALVPIAAS